MKVKAALEFQFLWYKMKGDGEARLQKLQERMNMPFDETRLDHQASLLALWKIAYPDVPLSGFTSEQWKEMGWQGSNPATDFRYFSAI